MPGIPSGESTGDARNRSIPVSELLTPFRPSVLKFFCDFDLDLIGELYSGLSHLPVDEGMAALGKKLEEHKRSKAHSVHASEDEDEEDEDEEDEDEDEVDEDEVDEDEKDREGGRLKLIDDDKKTLGAEEHQVYSECERECKKPRLAACVVKPEARETDNWNNPSTRQ